MLVTGVLDTPKLTPKSPLHGVWPAASFAFTHDERLGGSLLPDPSFQTLPALVLTPCVLLLAPLCKSWLPSSLGFQARIPSALCLSSCPGCSKEAAAKSDLGKKQTEFPDLCRQDMKQESGHKVTSPKHPCICGGILGSPPGLVAGWVPGQGHLMVKDK